MLETVVSQRILHRRGLPCAYGGSGRSAAQLVVGPGYFEVIEIAGRAFACHRSHTLRRIVLGNSDPCQCVATLLHQNTAHIVQQLRLAGRTHQRLAAVTQHCQSTVERARFGIGMLACGDITADTQHIGNIPTGVAQRRSMRFQALRSRNQT